MITVVVKQSQRRGVQPAENPDFVIVNWRATSNPHTWRPPTDVFEREEVIVVRVEIAGMIEEDFSILLDQNMLVIRGSRQDVSERRAYHQMEINFGEFIIAFEIKTPIDSERVRAEYQNGFLWVYIPKVQPKTIKVKENE